MECSLIVNKIRDIDRGVLNALRHQWNAHTYAPGELNIMRTCSTPYGINGMLTYRSLVQIRLKRVLNALRHQWNAHPPRPRMAISRPRCSTPYGINGMLTRYSTTPQPHDHAVLNALRHQWNAHGRHGSIRRLPQKCSTPYGINGMFTASVLTCNSISTYSLLCVILTSLPSPEWHTIVPDDGMTTRKL